MKTANLLLIDDHALFRSGMTMLLRTGLQNVSVREARSIGEAYLTHRTAPDLVLLDLLLHDGDGLDSIRPMRLKWPETSIVVVSARCQPETVQAARQRGCHAYISKTESPRYLLSVISRLLEERGLGAGPPAGAGEGQGKGDGEAEDPRATPGNERPLLTPRQIEVLDLLNEGLTNRAIGMRLNVSENTIRAHVQAILGALGATSRTEAIVAARRLGLSKG
ncbi:MAG: DNA-binding response regulator [Lautropia sp.]